MDRCLRGLIFTAVFLLPGIALAVEPVRVLVLPFEIFAQEDLTYLQQEIPSALRSRLAAEGAQMIDADSTDTEWRSMVKGIIDIRNFGIRNGADYVVWGSLTRVGQQFSLDARMVEALGEKPPDVFFTEGEGIENLRRSVGTLARDIGLKLFKREKVAEVKVAGNRRIEADAIQRIIKTKPGDVFLAKSISDDLKSIYAMGYFEDIRVEAEDTPGGKTIIFQVTEKPTIRVIRFKGNRVYDEKEVRAALTIKTGSILNIYQIQNNVLRLEDLYKSKNYHNVKISYEVDSLENNQADLGFIIDEGEKVRIKTITFEGNSAFTSKKLKKLMKTSEKGFFSWATSSGELNRDNLDQDATKLAAFYQNSGYINARVGEPQVDFEEDWIYITIKIEEGPRFRVGEVEVTGDLVLPLEELSRILKISEEEYYNREVVRNDVLALTDIYSDEGYAYADIAPRIETDPEQQKVNISYGIQKGRQVYFEKIIITGNTKTRDRVIRRELQVYEQELYSGKRLKRGIRNLNRLDYFEDVKVDTQKGSDDSLMVLKIDVKEKPTGAFTFGGGYSSVEDFFIMGSITQRNLFGRGQVLQLRAEIGGRSTQYILSFTEPWLFNRPLSGGFDLYNWERDYDDYLKNSIGGSLRFSYPVWDYTRAYLTYTYDVSDITDITENAADSIKELAGENVESSITGTLRYDSRDRAFNPTEGSDHSLIVKYAGLGGDFDFVKVIADTGWYIPLFWGTTGFLHGRGGYIFDSGFVPDYEKFYLGGINSLRGYEWREISLFDENGAKFGGDKFVQFNAEYIFPLIKNVGLVGVVFYDTGNVYARDDNIDLGSLRSSAGGGIRWYSPMGPLRIEYGYILDPLEGESAKGRWEFSMGGSF